jgi:ATP-dependent DNA helicase RecQ
MKDYKYVSKPSFGKGKDRDELFWHSIFRQSCLHSLMYKDIEKYGILKLTEAGKDFIKSPKSCMIPLNHDYSNDDAHVPVAASKGAALDATLMALLKDLRKAEGKRKSLQPWVIFSEPSLLDMATYYPLSLEDMANISGVSRGKAMRYGQPFISLINKYVEENEIDRPMDTVVKQVANRSKSKVSIIQGVDKKLGLEELATELKMTLEDLLVEMNNIVDSGTKLNINYYLEDNLDEEAVEEIYDYFKEADSESSEEAYNELKDDDITLEEILMVRIKFMTEMAN